MDHRVFVFLLLIWAKVEASNTTTKSGWTVLLKVFENCVDKNDSLTCLQQKVLNFATRMTQSKSLEIFEGLKFVRDEGIGRSISDSESTDLGTSLNDQIWNKIGTFIKTHSVEVNVPKFLDTDNEARKKKGGHGGILMMAAAAKGAMLYMGMHAIAALAGKALIVAKVALTIASVIALKKLLEGSGGKTSYEIVKHPQHSYVQTHSSSHEYGGGGGHGGGGYEGHYQKRSIAKSEINGNGEFASPTEFAEASDSWRFELPKKEPGVRFSTGLYDADESLQRNENQNSASNEGGEFFFKKHTADQRRAEISKHDRFALKVDGENGPQELGVKALNTANDLYHLRRSRLVKFI